MVGLSLALNGSVSSELKIGVPFNELVKLVWLHELNFKMFHVY